MRFPVVLFDLDGTIVDSGWIILASYRHATETVLGREFPDDVLMARGRRRAPRGADARVRRGEGGRARAARTASTTSRSTPSSRRSPGCSTCSSGSTARAGSSGSSARSGTTSSSSPFEALGFGDLLDVVVGSDEAPRGKPHPDQILVALDRLGADPDADRLRRRRALRHRRCEGGRRPRDRRHLGRHPHARADGGGGAGRGRRHGRRALCRPLTRRRRRAHSTPTFHLLERTDARLP